MECSSEVESERRPSSSIVSGTPTAQTEKQMHFQEPIHFRRRQPLLLLGAELELPRQSHGFGFKVVYTVEQKKVLEESAKAEPMNRTTKYIHSQLWTLHLWLKTLKRKGFNHKWSGASLQVTADSTLYRICYSQDWLQVIYARKSCGWQRFRVPQYFHVSLSPITAIVSFISQQQIALSSELRWLNDFLF